MFRIISDIKLRLNFLFLGCQLFNDILINGKPLLNEALKL